MPTYIYRGDGPAHIADIGVDVEPGKSFESPVELHGELFEIAPDAIEPVATFAPAVVVPAAPEEVV